MSEGTESRAWPENSGGSGKPYVGTADPNETTIYGPKPFTAKSLGLSLLFLCLGGFLFRSSLVDFQQTTLAARQFKDIVGILAGGFLFLIFALAFFVKLVGSFQGLPRLVLAAKDITKAGVLRSTTTSWDRLGPFEWDIRIVGTGRNAREIKTISASLSETGPSSGGTASRTFPISPNSYDCDAETLLRDLNARRRTALVNQGALSENFGTAPTASVRAQKPAAETVLFPAKIYGPYSPVRQAVFRCFLCFVIFSALARHPELRRSWSAGAVIVLDFAALAVFVAFFLNFFRIFSRIITRLRNKPHLALSPTGVAFVSGKTVMSGAWDSLGPFEIDVLKRGFWFGRGRRQKRIARAIVTAPNVSDAVRRGGLLSIKTWLLDINPDVLVSELNRRRTQVLAAAAADDSGSFNRDG